MFLTKPKSGLSAFVLSQGKQLEPVFGWTEQTAFGDLDRGFYVDQISRMPEPDLFRVRTKAGSKFELAGRVLDVGFGFLLETFESDTSQCIRCYSYEELGELKPLWSDFNYVSGRIETADCILAIKKLKGAKQQLEFRNATDGAIQWTGPTGHVSLGLRENNKLHVATTDTIDGICSCVLSISGGHNIKACQLCLPIDASWQMFELSFGGEALFLLPRSMRRAVVSLHGGPESFEWSNLRYGGLYRELLAENIGIVIFNYTGSTESGARCRTSGHGDFCNAVLTEFQSISQFLSSQYNIRQESISLFGGSFGASLSLFISCMHSCERIVISSPMSDLSRHVSQVPESSNYSSWFNTRFSSMDFDRLSLSCLSRSKADKVYIFHGKDDQVCRPLDTMEMAEKMTQAGLSVAANFPDDFGHAPSNTSELSSYLLWARQALF